MKKYTFITEEGEVLTECTCDSCGRNCKTEYDWEFMELETHWGFGTEKDGEKWTAQICEKCVKEKFGFIKFKVEEY